MNDYSEVTCHLQRDVVNLINALNDKKWGDAYELSLFLESDLLDLSTWIFENKVISNESK